MRFQNRIYFFLIFLVNLIPTSTMAKEKKYDISICMMFYNEAPYLKEWIEYHRLIGVDHFYLYNNESDDHYMDVLDPYIKDGIVELFFKAKKAKRVCSEQIEVYNSCIKTAVGATKWLAIIDSDEFILPLNTYSLKDFLKPFDEKQEIGTIQINWQCFGTSNIEELPQDKLMIEALIWKADELFEADEGPSNTHVKSIFKPEAILRYKLHSGILKKGYFVWPYEKNNKTADEQKINLDEIQINHYWSRDEKTFYEKKIEQKMTRGFRDYQRDFLIERKETMNNIKDEKIFKYVPQLRKIMGLDE